MSLIPTLINRSLGVKGNIVRVKFRVNKKFFDAYVPDDELWGAVKDILLNKEYEFLPEFEMKHFKNATIIDAGAHVGLFSLVASCFAKRIIAIEAHPVNYRLLEINIIKNHRQNVITLNKALTGKKTEKIKIYSANHTGGSSIIKKTSGTVSYEVSGITLRELIKKFGYVDLLKMDIEGAEFDVFKNIDRYTLTQIGAIVGEIHLKYGDINLIDQILKDSGFKVSYFYPPLSKKFGGTSIDLYGYNKLKILRKLIYTFSHFKGIKNQNLVILFASR